MASGAPGNNTPTTRSEHTLLVVSGLAPWGLDPLTPWVAVCLVSLWASGSTADSWHSQILSQPFSRLTVLENLCGTESYQRVALLLGIGVF